jgi:hypothetical protein
MEGRLSIELTPEKKFRQKNPKKFGGESSLGKLIGRIRELVEILAAPASILNFQMLKKKKINDEHCDPCLEEYVARQANFSHLSSRHASERGQEKKIGPSEWWRRRK